VRQAHEDRDGRAVQPFDGEIDPQSCRFRRSQKPSLSLSLKTLRRSAVNHRGGPLLPPGVTATQTLN